MILGNLISIQENNYLDLSSNENKNYSRCATDVIAKGKLIQTLEENTENGLGINISRRID